MGGRGSSSTMSSSGAGGGTVRLNQREAAMINGNVADLQRDWLEADEEWARSEDPETVAYDILNTEYSGRGADADIDYKLEDFGDYFDYDPDSDAQYDRVMGIALKLQKASNSNLLNKFPDVRAEYDRIKREEYE